MERSPASSSGPHVSFKVQKIIGISSEGNYQVQWAPAWVSKYHLVGCEYLIQEFLQRQGEKCNELEIQPQISGRPSPHNESEIPSSNNMECSTEFLDNDEHVPFEDFKTDLDTGSMENNAAEQMLNSDCDFHPESNKLSVKIKDELEETLDTLGAPHMILSESSQPLKTHTNHGIMTPNHTMPDTTGDCSAQELLDVTNKNNSDIGGNQVIVSKCREDVNNTPIPLLLPPRTKSQHKCAVCNKDFPQLSLLVAHLKTHSRDKRKEFQCTECDKTFASSSNLKQHQRLHTGTKPYSCTQCDAKFSWLTSFKQHQRTHSGVKPFQCEVCGRRFAEKSHLKSHMFTHTGEKPYKCDVCGKEFVQSNQRNRHRCTGSVTEAETIADVSRCPGSMTGTKTVIADDSRCPGSVTNTETETIIANDS